jgi:hypothetical protein
VGGSGPPPPTPLDATNYALAGIACPTTRACYAVGNQNTILISHDGGHSWHQPRTPGVGGIPTFVAVACHGERTCVAVGLDIGAPNSMLVVRTDNGGITWKSQAAMLYPKVTFETWICGLAGVACPTVQVCFVAAGDGTILRTATAGRSWSVVAQTNRKITGIACPTVSMCVVVGYFGYVAVIPRDVSMIPTATPTSAMLSQVPLGKPSSTPTPQPTATAQATTTPPHACSAWNIGGTWTLQAAASSNIGSGSGAATFVQTGSTVSGSVLLGGVSWTIQGAIQGTTLTLTWSAPGQVAQSDSGLVSPDGTSITDNFGTFTGKATCVR